MKNPSPKACSTLGPVLAGLILITAVAPVGATPLFVGDFAPSKWSLDAGSFNAGSYSFTGLPADVLCITGSSTPNVLSDTIVSLNSPYSSSPGLVSFNWTLAANGNMGAPLANFYIGTTQYMLSGNGGTVTGIALSAGTPFAFELMSQAESAFKGPAKLTISGWNFSSVPEGGASTAGLLVLVLGGVEMVRRKRGATITKRD